MKKNILLTLIALFCAMYAQAYDFKSGNFYYTITGENIIEVSQCDSRLTAAYIPTEITHFGTKYTVTGIGEDAFADCGNLTSVIIPESVIRIGDKAFRNCSNLISITIPNSVTSLGEGAFMDCSNLSSITIPNSVTSVGKNCFYNTLWYSNQSDGIVYINNVLYNYKGNMPQGTSIVIKDGTASICGYAFYNCTGLTSVSIPNSVTSIGSSTFYGCSNLTTITIPENIKCIEERTFQGCTKLTSIAIPNSVTSIGQSAFKSCGITSVTIPDRITSIESSTFENCARLTSITIPNSVKSIGDFAFSSCYGLTSITIPDSVTTIGDYAFYYCDKLSSIVVGKSVVSIGARCLKNCSKLTSVTWNAKAYPIVNYPDNPFCYRYETTNGGYSTDFDIRKQITSFTFGNEVDSIPMYLCEEMSNLTSITIPKSVTCIRDGAFRYCEGLTSVTIDNSATSINSEAFLNCKNISSVSFGNNVTSIGENAFFGCDALCSITIPNSVTSIGEKAFVMCSNLTYVIIGEGVTDIGKDAFTNCPMLMSVVWNAKTCSDFSETTAPFSQDKSSAYGYAEIEPITSFVFGKKVEHIPSFLCYGLKDIEDITFSNSVTSIGTEAFMGCEGLTSVIIPHGVKNMGNDVFKDCTGLTSVIWNAQNCDGWAEYDTSPFHKTKITSFSFGDEVESIPLGLCSGMNITTITIPNSVTSIGNYAFYDCKGFTSVTIPNSVTSVGNRAFSNCLSIMFLTIGDNVITIGDRAFESCTGLYSITIPNSVKSIGEYAFYNCSSLSSVIIGNGVNSIGMDAFEDCTSLSSVVIPNSVTSIGKRAFRNCNSLSIAAIGDGIAKIEGSTFSWCSTLTSVTIGNGIKDIAGEHQSSDYAFYGCKSLSTIVWNAKACRNFTYEKTPFVYGYRHQYYGESGYGYKYDIVFDLRKQITSFVFGEEVDSIPDYLCDGMTNIEYIRTEATTPPTIGYHSLNNIPQNIPVYVPCGTKNAYQNADGWNRFYNFIEPTPEFNYTITLQSANQEQGNVTITNEVKCENQVTIEATANTHYHFIQWSDGNTDNPRTLILTQDTTFIAEFAANEYTVSAIPSESKYGKVSGSGTYEYKTEVLLTVKTTDRHYHFAQWNDGNTDNPRTIIVTQDTTFTAEFAPNQYTIWTSGEHGTVEGAGTYDYKTRVCLTAIPDNGYHFVEWIPGGTDNPRYITVTMNILYKAEFAPNQYTITTYAQYGNVSGGGTYDYGTTATLTATADEHYHFTQWSDGNTDNPRTVAVEDNATYTAEFKPYSYIITVSAGEHGNVSGGGTYDYGTTATLTATADEHYHFTRWTDGNADNPRTVSVVGDATYIAEFKPNSYTITVYAGEHGNVNGAGTYDYGTTITLTATADEHYHFTRWSDGNTDNPRTILVEGDAVYTAEFLLNEYTITVLYDNIKGYVSGGGTYVYGTQVRLEVTANSGYQFSQWSNGATYNPYLLTATEDLTLEAQFIPATAVENVSADDDTAVRKVCRAGQVYILRNGKTYTTTGVEIK